MDQRNNQPSGPRRRTGALSVTIVTTVLFVLTIDVSSGLLHQTEPDLQSCADFDIDAGEKLKEACETHCFPLEFETFDYARRSDDGTSLVRNTVCRCCSDDVPDTTDNGGTDIDVTDGQPEDVQFTVNDEICDGRMRTFECWTKAEVWDMTTPIFQCAMYNITSLTTCQNMCTRIDPNEFTFSGSAGDVQCVCADDVVICDDNSGSESSIRLSLSFIALIATSVAVAITF